MKIIVIGATGTIGREVAELLAKDHDVVRVGCHSGALRVDIASVTSIGNLYEAIGPFHHLVCAAGVARFGRLDALHNDDFLLSLHNKLLGQINLVRLGLESIYDGGSFTLTSGLLAQRPMVGSAAISTVNAGLEGFVKAAALELPRGLRVNAVSPGWVSETLQKMGRDSSVGLPAARVALAYRESVLGRRSGEILDAKQFCG